MSNPFKNQEGPSPLAKRDLILALTTAGTLVTMCVSGVVWLGFSVLMLMGLGLERHQNYEYYGNYPLLYLGPAAFGFVVPAVLVWLVRPRIVAVGAIICLPLGTFWGLRLAWPYMGDSFAVGLAAMLVGAAAGTVVGLLLGKALHLLTDFVRQALFPGKGGARGDA